MEPDQHFVLASHVFFLLPCIYGLKRKEYDISLLTFVLALASTLYHAFIITGMDAGYLQYADFFLTRFSIVYVIFRTGNFSEKTSKLLTIVNLIATVTTMYDRFDDLSLAYMIGCSILIVLFKYAIYKEWSQVLWGYMGTGFGTIAVGIVFFILGGIFPQYYNWFHGVWHAMAFVTIYLVLEATTEGRTILMMIRGGV